MWSSLTEGLLNPSWHPCTPAEPKEVPWVHRRRGPRWVPAEVALAAKPRHLAEVTADTTQGTGWASTATALRKAKVSSSPACPTTNQSHLLRAVATNPRTDTELCPMNSELPHQRRGCGMTHNVSAVSGGRTVDSGEVLLL